VRAGCVKRAQRKSRKVGCPFCCQKKSRKVVKNLPNGYTNWVCTDKSIGSCEKGEWRPPIVPNSGGSPCSVPDKTIPVKSPGLPILFFNPAEALNIEQFNGPCKKHDICYGKCGAGDKAECDQQMNESMKQICKKKSGIEEAKCEAQRYLVSSGLSLNFPDVPGVDIPFSGPRESFEDKRQCCKQPGPTCVKGGS
jgi:hypothetical protein